MSKLTTIPLLEDHQFHTMMAEFGKLLEARAAMLPYPFTNKEIDYHTQFCEKKRLEIQQWVREHYPEDAPAFIDAMKEHIHRPIGTGQRR